MSEKLNSIIEIKEQLNLIIALRKEASDKISINQGRLNDLKVKKEEIANKTPIDNIALETIELQIVQIQTLINTLIIKSKSHFYDLDRILTSEQEEKFASIIELFNQKASIYTKNENENFDVKVTFIELDYIVSKHGALQFEMNQKGKLIIYPSLILLEDGSNSFYIVPTSELELTFTKKNEASNEAALKTSFHKNEVAIKIPAMFEEVYYLEDDEFFLSFQTKFNDYINLLKNLSSPPIKGIKKEYFHLVNEFGNKYFDFLQGLSQNNLFIDHLKNNSHDVSTNYLETMGILDLLKCFNTIADINDTSSNESFAIMFLQSKLNKLPIKSYEEIIKLNNQEIINSYKEIVNTISSELNNSKEDNSVAFILAELLINFDKELHIEYLTNIYQFSSIVIKADGKVSRMEEDSLKKIMNLTNQKHLLKTIHNNDNIEKDKTLEELLFDLYDLTGLQTVKQEINTLINLIKVKKAREEFDLKNTDMSFHIVFTGNPGTGKTTVARHLAKIYKCIGVLQKGHLIETDRSGLIAEFVGQTAVKVNKLVDSALNGVLFIDEAYAIYNDEKDAYGKEAIATLLKRMEDDRDKLIVVLAGYTNEMKSFIDSNPGLKSRFNKYIHFPDYSPDEMYSIFIGMSRKLNFILEDALPDQLKLRFLEEIEKGDTASGNGRFVRNIFEKMLENQANRLAVDTNLTKEKLSLLTVDDLPL